LWTRVQFPPAPPDVSLKAAKDQHLAAFFFVMYSWTVNADSMVVTAGNTILSDRRHVAPEAPF
jgi:hypothetical protein